MSTDPCAEWRLLVQADIDGELGPADSARVASHLEGCPECAAAQPRLIALSRRIRQQASYRRAPDTLTQRIAALAPAAPKRQFRLPTAVPFGAGLAMAAAVLLTVLPGRGDRLADEIASDHVRALQPGHLLDVVTSDRHTVKPWLSSRLDFSPAVPDLADRGFPLQGGRLDYVAGRPMAVLVYKRREHVIDVYVWPAERGDPSVETHKNGFNLVRWREGGLVYWAVSDLDDKELADFASLLRAAS